MVWITMSFALHAGNKKRKKSDSKPHSQINKCLNEKRRREQENIHIEELAELISASPSDMSSLSCKPDKCAILKETVNQIRSQKLSTENELCEELQQSEVSSSKPNIINNQIFGSILLEALEGFLFVVNINGKVEFVSENISTFIRYHQNEVYEKNIYDFIHPDDRARFNSNLLLMMPLGNGRDWNSENTLNSNKLTKHFNCRFLIKQDNLDTTMENRQPLEPQYESLNITANYIPLNDNRNDELRNGLTCIARRVVHEDKRLGLSRVEQFTTRIDRDGKVVDIDTSMLSQSSCQYLCKELLGAQIIDFCHPSDLATLKQHLKETFETEGATCIPYKFRVGQDRYARIKTKSKRFRSVQSNEEYVVSTHSVIRECENPSTLDHLKSSSSPSSVASTSSMSGNTSDSSTSLNGSIALSPSALSNSFGNFSSSDYGLSDLVLDMFPGTNWSTEPTSTQSKESDCTSFASSPQHAPLSNRSESAASPPNNAFMVAPPGRSIPSPVVQNRAPTPYGGSCYSPSPSSAGRSSPPRALSARSDSSLNAETSGIDNIRLDRQFDMQSNQKLRNLLTQTVDDGGSRQRQEENGLRIHRQPSQDEVTILIDSRMLEDSSRLNRVNQSVPRSSNVILRDLLNQDEEEAPVEPIRSGEGTVPNPHLNVGACRSMENSAQHRLGNNNMLRKLLNSDDSDRNYRKPQDLIHQLLISNSGNKSVSLQNERLRPENLQNSLVSNVPKPTAVPPNRGTADVTYLSESIAVKRKANDKTIQTAAKKSNNVHLAGQNPMLASMLAQTPRTPPLNVPESAASTIMNQLPQERLPKNLEKKLVHTPVTALSMNATSSVYTTVSNTIHRDVVTNDTRGHMLQHNPQMSLQAGLRTVYSQQQQHQQHQQQLLLDKLVVSGTDEDILLAKSIGHDMLGMGTQSSSIQNATTYSQLLSAYNSQLAASTSDSASSSLTSMLNDSTLLTDNSMVDSLQVGQGVDNFNERSILEQIYSLQEDHKITASQKASNPATILKILSDTLEFPETNMSSQVATSSSSQDINEKIAISAIQKELMEASTVAIASRAGAVQNAAATMIPTYSQAGRSFTQVSGGSSQLTTEQILMLHQQQQQQQQLVAGSQPPNYNLVANRVRLPVTTTQSNVNLLNQEILAQAQRRNLQMVRNVNVANMNANQIRKTMKQRLYLQQQQKRLLEQQQKQQLTMQTQQPLETGSSAVFTENMNDLLNNSVAPNVTLLRSSGIPEVPGSARFNLASATSLPSPTSQASPTSAQLSPSQRSINQSSPFSPVSQLPSQTPPPTSYQTTTRLSPLPPPSYASHSPSSPHMVLSPQPQSPQWNQRLATSPIQNIQMQNPMLNAQLSQASIGANQVRLTAQQRQQLALRSMPNPNSVQNSRGGVYSPQSDGNSYSPLSPVMVLQSQQQPQQQRIQRARIASGSQNQTSNFSTNEPLPSPQPLPSPSFSQSAASTPTSSSSYVSISSDNSPLTTYSLAPATQQHFTFERQNLQTFVSSPNDSLTSQLTDQGSSNSLRQELQSLITSQNQLLLSSNSNNHQLVQSLSSGSVTRVLNIHSLSREALEELGLSVELMPASVSQSIQGQSGSQSLYAQALLNNTTGSLENTVQPASPRVHLEEPKPADQKKSLLQQLLSEPT